MRTRSTSIHRSWRVWLALCVLLMGALAPTVSRALAWSEAGPALEICTGQGGSVWVSAPPESSDEGAADGPTSLPSLEHCPFCLQATDRSAAPPPHQPYLFLEIGGNQARPVRQALFFVFDIQRVPPARGPPVSA